MEEREPVLDGEGLGEFAARTEREMRLIQELMDAGRHADAAEVACAWQQVCRAILRREMIPLLPAVDAAATSDPAEVRGRVYRD